MKNNRLGKERTTNLDIIRTTYMEVIEQQTEGGVVV